MCDYHEIALAATPAEDYAFDYWWDDKTPGAGDVESPGLDEERAEMVHRNYNERKFIWAAGGWNT
ncbi:MAG TPA: hypothetical protein PKI11_20430, partial [Candidatus Hydrogenedentes bacterium]|nr:hypothetical protein [Candidatus Hydrogenedentota bacterium]